MVAIQLVILEDLQRGVEKDEHLNSWSLYNMWQTEFGDGKCRFQNKL